MPHASPNATHRPPTGSEPTRSRDATAALLCLGYSLHFMVITLIGWPGQPSTFFGGAVYDDALGTFSIARGASFCLGFVACAALSMALGRRWGALLARTPAGLLFSMLIMAGAAVLCAGVPSSGVRDTVCGTLLGLGLAGNFVLYQHAICLQRSPLDAWCLIGGTAGGAVLYFILTWLPMDVIRPLVVALITPACGVIALVGTRRVGDAEEAGVADGQDARGVQDAQVDATAGMAGAATQGRKASPSRLRALGNGVLALAIPTFAIGVIAAVMMSARLHFASSAGVDLIVGSPLNVGLILGALITLTVYLRTGYRVDTGVYVRAAVPAIALASLGLPFFGEAYGSAFTLVLYVLFVVGSIDLILACSQATRFYGIPATALYALSFGIVYTMRFVPTLVFAASERAGAQLDPFASTCLLALAFVSMLFAVHVADSRYGALQRKNAVYTWTTLRARPLAGQEGAAEPEPASTQDAFERFAGRHGLTPREAQVAQLFIEGRTVPYVAERLVVSESTVKFHSKNIYAKCAVAGRQDLLDLYARELAEGAAPAEGA